MKAATRFFGFFLVLVMCLSLFPASALAQEEPETSVDSEYAVEGTSSVGELIANTLDGQAEQGYDGTDLPGSITDITVEGTTATVELSTDRDAALIVAVYTEDGAKMLGSGKSTAAAEDGAVTVDIVIDEMPEYFTVGAYLLDAETHEPLSTEYISRYYTQEFQEFLSTTVDDYDEARVLNLDDDNTTNFLVFSEETILADAGTQVTDNGNGTYTITNADAAFLAIKPGDSFAYTYPDGAVLIVVAKDVHVDGTTVTITDDADAELVDVFAYVRIEATSDNADAEVDTGEMSDCLTYLGESDDVFPLTTDGASDTDFASSDSLTFHVDKKTDGDVFKGSISGKLTYSYKATAAVYAVPNWQYIKFEVENKISFSFDVDGTMDLSIKLPSIKFSPVAFVNIELNPTVPVKFDVSLTFTGELKKKNGFEYDSDTGETISLDSPYKIDGDIRIEGKFTIGLSMEVKCYVGMDIPFTDKTVELVSFSLSFSVAGEIKGSQKILEVAEADVIHDCLLCIEGTINVGAASKVIISFFQSINIDFNLLDASGKLYDWYYSLTYGDHGLTTCPHISYKVTVTVLDENGEPVEGAVIEGAGLDEDPTTGEDGNAIFYLPNGEYELTITKDNASAIKSITIRDGTKKLDIPLIGLGQGGSVNLTDVNIEAMISEAGNVVGSGKCGLNVVWNLYENGLLVLDGTGIMYLDCRDYASYCWSELSTLAVKNGVTSIGTRAFSGCRNLTNIILADSVTSIGEQAFEGCTSLKTITLPEGLTGIEREAFRDCRSLSYLKIPGSVTFIGTNILQGCSGLEGLMLPCAFECNNQSSFGVCENVTELTFFGDGELIGRISDFPNVQRVTILNGVTDIGKSAFSNYDYLTSVVLPASIINIDDSAFYSCNHLSSIDIPSSIVSIGDYAFSWCTGLTSVEIPKGITRINDGVFAGCCNLTRITIPDSVTSIGNAAFYDCASLTDVYYTGAESDWAAIGIGSSNDDYLTSATLHYNSSGSFLDGAAAAVFDAAQEVTIVEVPDPIEEGIPVEDVTPSAVETEESEAEELPEDTESPEDTELTEDLIADSLAVYSGVLGAGSVTKTAAFSDLVPGAAYILIVSVAGAEDMFAPINLLFIAQGTADDDGTLAFSYIPRTNADADAAVFGMSNKNLSDAVVVLLDDGTAIVTYGGDVLLEDEDFTVSRDDIGVTVTGRDQYAGSKTVFIERPYTAAIVLQAVVGIRANPRVYTAVDAAAVLAGQ